MTGRLPPGGFTIQPLAVDDAPALTAAYERNRAHLAPWEPLRSPEFYTEPWQRNDAESKVAGARAGQQDPWVIWHDTGHEEQVIGRINMTNIARGVFQSASLGFWVDHDYTGRGVATEAVRFAVGRATDIGLHRLEAGTLAHNDSSQAVLRRSGFKEIGAAPRYLFIAGSWQDHILFQRILHDDRPA